MTVAGVTVHRVIRRLQSINASFYVALILLATCEYASAQDVFGPVKQSCGYKRAYAVGVKLLAVYASHILTIRLEPGLSTYRTVVSYVTAALLPAATAVVAFRDLWYRRCGYRDLPSDGDTPKAHRYKDMQHAINAGAVCVRIHQHQIMDGMRLLHDNCNVRAKALEDDGSEVFVGVPPGTPARLFAPTLIQGNSQLFKAVVGAIQLALATLQLISASNPRVAAYGYGSFVYTIIPYAIGSGINIACAIFTTSYTDITEMELASDLSSPTQTVQGMFVFEYFFMKCHFLMALPLPDLSFLVDELDRKAFVAFNLFTYLQLAIYLAIIGGKTQFRRGISTSAQRGWFVSWAVLGIFYGSGYIFVARAYTISEGIKTQILSFTHLLHYVATAATVGGVVVMVQQYLQFVEC